MSTSRSLLRCLSFTCALATASFAPAARADAPVLTMDEAIRAALAKNPQIRVQSFGRSIARADLLAARGQFDPALTFTRTYSEASSPYFSGSSFETNVQKLDYYSAGLQGSTPWGLRYNLGGTANNSRYSLTNYTPNFDTFGGLQITQPLLRGFGFGANLAAVRIAKANRGIADWEFRRQAIDTVTQVIDAYSDVVYAQQAFRIAQRSRELSSGLVEENQRRWKAGTMSESDVEQARAYDALLTEGVLYAEQGLRDAVNRLRQLMGETEFPIDPPAMSAEPLDQVVSPVVNLAEDLKQAYDLRPDYQEARLGLTKNRANAAQARNALLPQVDFQGSYGYTGADANFARARQMVRDRTDRTYSAGVVVSIPLTFAEGRGRARSAKLQLLQAEADLDRLKQDIALAIASAAGQIETTRKRVDAGRNAYQLANSGLTAELKKLRAGTSSTQFVLSAQERLISAEEQLYRALADQRRAQAEYDRQLGRTLLVHSIAVDKL